MVQPRLIRQSIKCWAGRVMWVEMFMYVNVMSINVPTGLNLLLASVLQPQNSPSKYSHQNRICNQSRWERRKPLSMFGMGI